MSATNTNDQLQEELYDAIEDRDRLIDELEDENDKQQDELIVCRDEIAKLQVLLKEVRLDNDSLLQERSELEEQANTYKSQLDAQKNIIAIAKQQSEQAKKIQRDGNNQMHRLELENQRLTATILEIEENEDILVNEIDTLATEKSHYQGQYEEAAAKCDLLYQGNDEKARINAQLTKEKKEAEFLCRVRTEEYKRELDAHRQKDEASKLEITRLLTELEEERSKQKQYFYVKQNESFKRELTHVRKENQNLHSLYDQCLLDKNNAERDLDSAIQALNYSKRNAKEQAAKALRAEKVVATSANTKLERANAKLESANQRTLDLEGQLDDLRLQLERSEARNSAYEQNHGLNEAVKCQKQLEADVRRRQHDLKRANHALGVEMDKNRALSKACDWLKEKANVGPDFAYDDEEIKLALKREDSILQSENAELSRQIEAIEEERLKLLSQLRQRAIDIGSSSVEKGVRFLGMSSQQVAQVMEFATNLREGKVTLPLNDRSKELLAELASLKSDREVDRFAIAKLERELSAKERSSHESESNILKSVIDNITTDNKKLRDEISTLKASDSSAINAKVSSMTPTLRQRAEQVLGQDLVAMPATAEVQFIHVINEYDKTSHELDLLKKSMATSSTFDANKKSQSNATTQSDIAPTNESPVSSKEEKREQGIQSSVDGAIDNLRRERDAIAAQLKQLVFDANQSGQIELVSEERTKLTEKLKSVEKELNNEQQAQSNVHDLVVTQTSLGPQRGVNEIEMAEAEMKSMNKLLEQTQQKLSGYTSDLNNIRHAICKLQDSRINSAKVALQISCLNDIIQEKTRVVNETRQKLASSKQMNLKLSRDMESRERRSDRSVSTNSIDRSIFRVANNDYGLTNNNLQQHLEEASRLIFEKENVIRELNTKLNEAGKSHEQLSKEAESMKHDISTLVSRLNEAESAVNGIDAYQERYDEAEALLQKSKKEVSSLKSKLALLAKEKTEKDTKIQELNDTVARTKRVLSVTKQGRARSEQNLKTANDEILSLKEQLEKTSAQITALKKDKIDAQNEKLQATRRARLSATKLKDLTDQCNKRENPSTVEELEKRVNVLNKTVSGLATTNSKLRGELASMRLKNKDDDTAVDTRKSYSRERPSTAGRAKSLETQVKSLQNSLKIEKKHVAELKKHTAESSAMLDKYQKRITNLERALRSSPTPNNGEETERSGADSSHLHAKLLSLENANKDLQQRIKDISNTSDGNVGAQLRQLKAENDSLKKENERLSQIDHLDFFEEIEDLKYKYNEAVRQIDQLARKD